MPSREILLRILRSETADDVQLLDTTAQALGKTIAKGKVTTSQIRTIFSEVRTIELQTKRLPSGESLPLDVVRPLRMLRPKLAYQYGRTSGEAKTAMKELTETLSEAIDLVGENQA